MDLSYIISIFLGYLCGSVPFGYLVAKKYGVNILEKGSGNIGATNVSRVLGKKPGIIVFVLDLLKGVGGVQLPILLIPLVQESPSTQTLGVCGLIGGVCAILGHNFTIWLKFRGGKGIATTAGVLVGLTPYSFIILTSTWGILFKITRYVSLASIIVAFMMPIVVYFIHGIGPLFWATCVLGALAIYRHRANIQRLLNGTESRFVKKDKSKDSDNG